MKIYKELDETEQVKVVGALSAEEIVEHVTNGDYGNNQFKDHLSSSEYDYNMVRKNVEERLNNDIRKWDMFD